MRHLLEGSLMPLLHLIEFLHILGIEVDEFLQHGRFELNVRTFKVECLRGYTCLDLFLG